MDKTTDNEFIHTVIIQLCIEKGDGNFYIKEMPLEDLDRLVSIAQRAVSPSPTCESCNKMTFIGSDRKAIFCHLLQNDFCLPFGCLHHEPKEKG